MEILNNKNNINEKKNIVMNNQLINELKTGLNMSKNEIQRLNNIVNGYKSQNNKLTMELGQINKEKENEINSLKFTIELQKKQIIEISSNEKLKEKKLIEVQSELDVVSNTYKNLERTNQALVNDYNDIINDFNLLKENILKDRKEEENINVDLDVEKINEELKQLKHLIKQRNEEFEILNKEYNKIKDEYYLLNNKYKDNLLEIERNKIYHNGAQDKNYEILFNKYQKLKKENEYNLKKKKYYKEQNKLSNEIIDVIKTKLTKEQIKQIENDKSFQQLLNIKTGNKIENSSIYNSNSNNNNNYKPTIINNNINKENNNKSSSNIMINYENENNNGNNFNNNNIVLNDKFNNNIINDIDNKNDKGKNNEEDISEHISFYESVNK
jgi:hypothetical protein